MVKKLGNDPCFVFFGAKMTKHNMERKLENRFLRFLKPFKVTIHIN